jgi:peroxiredoxin family protein
MFAKMMPRDADKMGLSNMNFAGMGPKMIKHVVKKLSQTHIFYCPFY